MFHDFYLVKLAGANVMILVSWYAIDNAYNALLKCIVIF